MHFHRRVLFLFFASAMMASTAWIWGTTASAEPVNVRLGQAAEGNAGFAAHVHTGDCTLFDPTNVIGSGEAVSKPGGEGMAYSFDFELDVAMSVVVETPHAVTIESLSSDVAVPQACGEIVGTASDGRLMTGIWSLETGLLEGVAVLEPSGDDSTSVSVYLVLSGEGDQPAQEDAEDDDGGDSEPDDDDVDDPEGGL